MLKLKRLRYLRLDLSAADDISALSALKAIELLSLSAVRLRLDWSVLKPLRALRNLSLWGGESNTLQGIGQMPQLRQLLIAFQSLDDLSPLAELANLESLDLIELPELDLAPLANMRSLRHLEIFGTKTKNIDLLRARGDIDIRIAR